MADRKPNTGLSPAPGHMMPDFCNNQAVLLIILIAELLAIVLSLSQTGREFGLFYHLAYTSLFIQTVALVDAALLCYTKRWYSGLQPVTLGIVIYLLLQSVTALVTVGSHLFITWFQVFSAPVLSGLGEALFRNVGISAIITAVIMRYFYIQNQSSLRQQQENEARIQALQARIRPHFLFNSLNTIANLTHSQPSKAEDALLDLAELFRSTLTQRNQITLSEELKICRQYLHMEQLRLGERLSIAWDIAPDAEKLSLPALVLQPLIENAIYHGIEPLSDGGEIKITAKNTDNTLMVQVRNPVTDKYVPRDPRSNRVAVENIQQRLALAYEGNAIFKVEENANDYMVTMMIPADRSVDENPDR